MIELSQSTTEPEVVERVVRKSMTAIERLRQVEARESLPAQKFSLKKLFNHLQNKFSHSLDVADLIESEVQSRTAELYRKANFDALTHLPNRAHFHEMLDKLVQRYSNLDHPFTLLFLDLDGFKKVNDTLGHSVGDELLRHVSARLLSSVREGDIVSRLGGDEFVVLLADTDDTDVIEGVCKRIIHEVSRPYWFGSQEVKTSSSIGIASFPQDAKTAAQLIENADEALYVSKSKGKKTFRFYRAVADETHVKSHFLQMQFEDAIQKGHLKAFVEPQIDLKNNRLLGGSATLFWQGAKVEDAFLSGWLPLLKKSGWEHSVALWLLDTGFYYLNQWSQINDEFVVSIPVLEALWRDDNFERVLNSRLERYQVKASQVQLEFSLKEFVSYDAFFQQRLKQLASQGFQITLTGLGAFALDLSLMAGLQIQEFKFDQAWLKKQLKSLEGQKWLQAIVSMGQALDSCMICTGVSTSEEAQLLLQLGCSLGQGELWSRPVPIEQFVV